MAICYNCGSELSIDGVVGRSLECPSCAKPVRCCKNCRFYQPGAHWDCRETIPEAVLDKERANFCDYFKLNELKPGDGGGKGESSRRSARNDFDALFS